MIKELLKIILFALVIGFIVSIFMPIHDAAIVSITIIVYILIVERKDKE